MSVAVELAGDDVRVAADDGVEVGAPHPHAVHVARWDVAQDVHLPQDCSNSKMIVSTIRSPSPPSTLPVEVQI